MWATSSVQTREHLHPGANVEDWLPSGKEVDHQTPLGLEAIGLRQLCRVGVDRPLVGLGEPASDSEETVKFGYDTGDQLLGLRNAERRFLGTPTIHLIG
jgi:hypothetical protein